MNIKMHTNSKIRSIKIKEQNALAFPQPPCDWAGVCPPRLKQSLTHDHPVGTQLEMDG